MPYQYQYPDTVSELARALIGIHQARLSRERQARLDAIAEEERQRANQRQELSDRMASEGNLIRLAPLLAQAGASGTALSELTQPTGDKLDIPDLTYEGIRSSQEAGYERQHPTEILTQEVLDAMPDFYKKRWKGRVGQRVRSEDVGSIGMEILKSAGRKAEAEARAGGRAPTSRRRAGRVEQYDSTSGTWVDQGPEDVPKPPEPAKKIWVTDTATRQRVQLTQDQLDAAPPGKYSDIRPATPGGGFGAAGMQRQQEAKQAAVSALGSEQDSKGDTLWAIVNRMTVPGPEAIAGPLAGFVAGPSAWLARKMRAPGSSDLRIYKSQIEGFAPLFARAVGHTGNLTERDATRTEALFPVLEGPGADSKSEANRKLRLIKAYMTGEKPVPAGLFDVQPGIWPPPTPAAPGADEGDIESQLLEEYGYPDA